MKFCRYRAWRTSLRQTVKWLACSTVLTVALLSASSTAQLRAAQTDKRSPPQRETVPDIEGVWANNTVTPLERPKQLADRALLTDEEVATLKARAARLADGGPSITIGDQLFLSLLTDPDTLTTGSGSRSQFWSDDDLVFERRTSLITDPPNGRLPPLTPEAVQRQQAAETIRRRPAEGPESLRLFERCLSYAVPPTGYLAARNNSYYQIVQAPGYVVIHSEILHEARVIPLDARPRLPESVRWWSGDARARWEHGSLVIESTNFRPNLLTFTGASDALRLTERLTPIDADTIEYQLTVDDPKTWTKPWTAMVPWKRSSKPMLEFACHEGNHAVEGILRGARADEQAESERK